MNKKIIYLFYTSLGLNIILLSTVLVFIFQNKLAGDVSILAVDEKQYIARDLNFSIEYPDRFDEPSLIIIDDESRPDIGSVYLGVNGELELWHNMAEEAAKIGSGIEGGPDGVLISVYKNPKKLSPKDWVIENTNAQYIVSNYNQEYLTQNLENIHTGNGVIEGIKYSWCGLMCEDVVVFLDKRNELVYMVRAIYMSNSSSIRGDLWYIINSFSFLN
ncbi:hypothetical protein KJ641_00900 [Patescibacteria group bacterium]|nr:hypothetical protein [Patescibacteria group bacterium]MBU1895416.1 hypothetical protein [Patescibacteria group bacterium]